MILYPESKSAYIASQPLKLTTTEFDILVLLISNTDKVFSRELLFNKLGMKDFQGDTRSIDMHIQRLRKKIAEFTNVKYIETVFGIGYKIGISMKPSFKSKLTFKTRMILINTAISVFIIALIGFVIVQGIVTYSFNNYVSNLVTTANEATTLIKQSISSTQTTGQESAIYKSGALFMRKKFHRFNSIQVILYDTDLNIVGSSFDNLDNTYTNYASTVMDSGVASYVYTSIDNSNYVILFTPMTINNTEIGLSALFVSTAATDKLVSKTLLLFLYAIIGAAIVSALTFAYANSRMFRPITQLTDYSKNAAKGDLQSFPNIDYRGEDEIKDLIVSTSSMVSQLKQKIDESNFEREKLSAVISSMQDAVIAVNLSNEILTTNKKLNEFFSTDSNYFEIIPHIDDTIKKVFSTREDVSYEFQYGEKYFVMSGNLIATSNNEDGVLIVIRDITALKKIEEEQNKFMIRN